MSFVSMFRNRHILYQNIVIKHEQVLTSKELKHGSDKNAQPYMKSNCLQRINTESTMLVKWITLLLNVFFIIYSVVGFTICKKRTQLLFVNVTY